MNKEIKMRQEVAEAYTKGLNKFFLTPMIKEGRTSVWAQYTIQVKNRRQMQRSLKIMGIPTAAHYPILLHLQKCFLYLSCRKGDFPIAEKVSYEVMSLPMNPFMEEERLIIAQQLLASASEINQ